MDQRDPRRDEHRDAARDLARDEARDDVKKQEQKEAHHQAHHEEKHAEDVNQEECVERELEVRKSAASEESVDHGDHAEAEGQEADTDDEEHAEFADDEEYEADADSEARSRTNVRRIGLIVACCIMLVLLGTALGVGMFVANGLHPVEAQDREVRIKIEPGMTSAKIAQLLEEHGLIRSEFVFRYYLKVKGEGSRFQAGEYLMKPGMELDEIISMLNRGDTVKEPTIKFTIPEGYTIERIADKLAEERIVDRDVFLEMAAKTDLYDSEYVKEIPADEDIVHALEGYLFPETYEMRAGSTEQEIIQRMVSELSRKLAQLPEDWPLRLEELGLTFHELLTIASLIEREAAVDAERPLIAGVIYNRLKQDMLLQIDATVQYALGEHKEVLLIVDTEVDSPYNTYKVKGLPPGPIASPGLESIRAALYPAETSYLFYVTKKDGSQEHLFAETYQEHLRNIELSKSQ